MDTAKRTTLSLTQADLDKIAELQARENINSLAGIIRWAINRALVVK